MPVSREVRLPARPKPAGAANGSTVPGTGPITNPYEGLQDEFEQPIGPELTDADLDAIYRRAYALSETSRRGAALSAVQRAGGDVSSPYYAQQAGGLAAGSAANAARSLTDVHLQDLFNRQRLEQARRQGLLSLAGAEGQFGLAGRGQLFGEEQYRDSRQDYERNRRDSALERQLAELKAMLEIQQLQGQGQQPQLVAAAEREDVFSDNPLADYYAERVNPTTEVGTPRPPGNYGLGGSRQPQPQPPTGPDTGRGPGSTGNLDYDGGGYGSYDVDATGSITAPSTKKRKPKLPAYAGM